MIRRATPGDIPRMLPLVEEYWRFECIPGFDAARVGRSLAQLLSAETLGAGWIAECRTGEGTGGSVAGYLLVVRGFSLEYGGPTAEIDEFFVSPQRRSAGLGRALLAAAEDACRAAGCVRLELQLGRGNAAARRFYERCGYAARADYELLEKLI
jgi:GNAT superfamily N-acetyltransferase